MDGLSFHPIRPLEDIPPLLRSESRLVVVEWFIGEEGLKDPSLKVHSVLKGIPNVTYCLYDLTAWTPFRSNRGDLTCESPLVKEINDTFPPSIRAVASSAFFNWIRNNREKATVILSDPRLYQVSATYPKTNITLSSLGLPDPLNIGDAGHAYSAYQYLEVLFLVDHLSYYVPDPREYHLMFVLPNDETKYYLVKSLEEFLADLQPVRWKRVSWVTFTYGNKPYHRPYSGNNKTIKEVKGGDL